MGDLTSGFLEAARGIFAQMRNEEIEYKDNIESIGSDYINTLATATTDKKPSIHALIYPDKDKLMSNLASSHDLHLQIIDAREDVMMTRVKNWYNDYIELLERDESETNRRQILEIFHFLEHQREEFDALQLQLRYYSSIGDPLPTNSDAIESNHD